MGIKGLPEVLKPYLIPVEVSRHRGKRAAVDAYSWLHKGMYGCAYDLGVKNHYWKQQRRDPPYVRYCVHRAQMLRHFGVTPVIVFDGDRLPAKGGEEKERRDRRAECMRKGHEKMAVGDKDGAAFFFAQGLDVTPAMAHELIAALKREGFEFVVAPYEADAQIAALAQLGGGEKGGVDVVFTEDSDLVAYGCPTVLFKLDKPHEALDWIRKAVENATQPDPTLYDHLGDIYHSLGDLEQARDAWRKSLELEPALEAQKKLDANTSVPDPDPAQPGSP